MTSDPNPTDLRSLRRNSGLSQKALAALVGLRSGAAVSRHECFKSIPDLLTALAYEAVFRVPADKIFSGVYENVETAVGESIGRLVNELQQSTVKGRGAAAIAQELEFFSERDNGNSYQPGS